MSKCCYLFREEGKEDLKEMREQTTLGGSRTLQDKEKQVQWFRGRNIVGEFKEWQRHPHGLREVDEDKKNIGGSVPVLVAVGS